MSEVLTEKDDEELEIVEVEQLPAPGSVPESEEDDDAPAAGDDEDEEDGEDARLAEHEDDDTDKDKKRPFKRLTAAEKRQNRKQAKDRTLAELAFLREKVASFEQLGAKITALEGNAINANEAQVDQRLEKAKEDQALAERILSQAIVAQNAEDITVALRLRDEAKGSVDELTRVKGGFADLRTKKDDAPDPTVTRLSSEWKSANGSWYGSNPTATSIANSIDAQVLAEGYNPATPAYWNELTRRVQSRFEAEKAPAAKDTGPRRKTPPPQGQSREHAPATTRKEVYVTPERKAAMVDAGIWDDPVRRSRVLKAYAEQDRSDRLAK